METQQTYSVFDYAAGIPEAVLEWMAVWGMQPPVSPCTELAAMPTFLPAASGSTLHQVARWQDAERVFALACCRNGSNAVSLVAKDPLVPGECVPRGESYVSADNFTAWQKIGAALDAYANFKSAASGATREKCIWVDEALRVVAGISQGRYFREDLLHLSRHWQQMPVEVQHLLPWLVLAAANGIERLCSRCERESRIVRPFG